MTVRPILRWPDDRLGVRCAPVAAIDDPVRALAQDLLDTMYAAPGRGLAAPQVGELVRLCVIDIAWRTGNPAPVVMVNPQLLWTSDACADSDEGCLSIPGVVARITRPVEIGLRWTALDGSDWAQTMSGVAAVCAQHELDHLDGIVTLDRLAPAVRAQVLEGYGA
jgi:peptide deformylase